MRFLIAVVMLLSVVITMPALGLPDSIYVTVQNGTERCMTLVLPDDSGWMGRGDVEYAIAMSPAKELTWSDFSYQKTRKVNENNSWQLPICFTRKSNASCGERFTLTISAPSVGVLRTISGGVCESSFAGVSTAPAAAGQSVGSALNQNFGLFDMAFSGQIYYVQPNGIVNITVLASSYQSSAALHATLTAGSMSVSPAANDVDFGTSGGQRQLLFQVQAPATAGTHDLALTGSLSGCSTAACSMTRHASLVVGSTPPARGGFSAQLFPTAINTEKGRPVVFRLIVYNNEAARSFNISMLKPYGIETDFIETSLTVGGGAQQSIDFNITPTGTESSYEFDMYVKSGENTKMAAGYVNVNGMAAGAQRALDMVQATGNLTAMAQARQAYNQFQSDPSLNSYGTLQDELDRIQKQASQGASSSFQNQSSNMTTPPVTPLQNYTPAPTSSSQGSGLDIFGKDMWILVVVVGALFAASIVIYTRKGKKSTGKGLRQEFEYREGQTTV